MPSTMIHLLFADIIHDDYPIEYYIGTFAPDAIAVRKDYIYTQKDKLHFRTSKNPLHDIAEFARSIDMSIPYCEGYIVHLFLDTYWDKECMIPFKESAEDNNWIKTYKTQISAASSAIYCNDKKLAKIWDTMTQYKMPVNYNIQGITNEEIEENYKHNNAWHEYFKKIESTLYPLDFVYDFCERIAEEYTKWVKEL